MKTEKIFDEHYEKGLVRGCSTCCPGCTDPLFWRMALRSLGPDTVIFGHGACAGCATARNIRLPVLNFHFSFASCGASGMVAAYKTKKREELTVVSVAGDGTISDISFGKVSAAAERNENMIQVCVDNEAYMNTGIQKSGLTPIGAWTTTTTKGKSNPKKRVAMIIAQHGVPYVATVSIAYPNDLMEKMKKAKVAEGFRYIHSYQPCPTGWRFNPSKGVEIGRLGVETWINPMWEVVDGEFKLTLKPKQKPVEEYLKAQGRFRGLTDEQIKSIQSDVDLRKEKLLSVDGTNIIY